MTLSRRDFMATVGASALATSLPLAARAAAHSAAHSAESTPADVHALIQRGLDAATRAGASYADVRVERLRHQGFASREDHLVHASDDESYGLGVRVIVDGVWGFAGTNRVDAASVVKTAQRAVGVARGDKRAAGRKVALAPTARAVGKWASPMSSDPFAVPLDQKVDALLRASRAAMAVTGARLRVRGHLAFVRHEKIYGSTEGSFTEQVFVRTAPTIGVTAVDEKRGDFESASSAGILAPAQMGFEGLEPLTDAATQTAERAIKRLGARTVEPGRYDLVLAPSNLWLTIHESVGHPTELDRALGYEANMAGTSFATPDQTGKLRYGSELVNVVADRTQKGALGSCGWDDDGMAADAWDLIRQGTLVGFQTTREQGGWVEGLGPHATSFAESWSAVPFQRMPNVSLKPGTHALSPEQLIADTRRGIFIEGNGSYSIDQQRYNFQFGGQGFQLIENGKLTRPLRAVAYQSNTLDFWRSLDAICDVRDYRLGGAMDDGKGEPMQSNPVSHGCATSRFRNVNVLDVRA